MPHGAPWPLLLRSPRRVIALAALMLALVTVLRLWISNPIEAVGFLYVIPISFVGAELGWRGGAWTAGAAMLLTIGWALLQNVPLGVFGYGARGATFFAVGLLVGLQGDLRRRLEAERERLIAELSAGAMRDQLTGLPNRRAWEERFAHELRAATRGGRTLSVAAIDIDGLKLLNDTFGHAHGDEVIEGCARAWRRSLRDIDFIARIGGDEFLAVLPACSALEAELVVRRMAAAAALEQPFSVGIATWDGVETGTQLVARADQTMYAAKAAGGARVTTAYGGHAGELGGAAASR
jgi:diguanylate cyclase (GGDEF)-like protein